MRVNGCLRGRLPDQRPHVPRLQLVSWSALLFAPPFPPASLPVAAPPVAPLVEEELRRAPAFEGGVDPKTPPIIPLPIRVGPTLPIPSLGGPVDGELVEVEGLPNGELDRCEGPMDPRLPRSGGITLTD